MLHHKEVIFCVDENNIPIVPQTKGYAHKQGIWHRTSQVWVFNRKQEILCHLRSALVHVAQNKWDPNFGGHAKAGDSAITTALAELKEESGIIVTEQSLVHIMENKYVPKKEYVSVFGLQWDGDWKDIKFQEEEVTEVKWIRLLDVEKCYLNLDPTWTQVGHELKVISHLRSIKTV